MLIELRYQCYIYVCALEIIWEIIFCSFSSLFFFQIFCMKCPDGVSGRLDGAPVCPDDYSSCPDDTIDSSGRSFFLSRRACFCDLYVALYPDVI
jgi:hypothetical protein